MLEYIEANKLKDDEFFKMLCDDIYVAIKSFDMEHGLMYTAARQTSQGRQQTYTPRIQETTTTLKRGYTLGPKTKELDTYLLSQYEPSQNDITPYTTIGQAKLMREVSYTLPLDDATDKP